jgi:riboflavin kinase / FMN adenylyltransferase
MEVVHGLESVTGSRPLVVAVGIFDGIHRGHVRLLRRLVSEAVRREARPTVITFEPHPDGVLRERAPLLACDPGERLARIEAAGVALTVVQTFDRDFAAQSAEAFLRRVAAAAPLRAVVMSPESAFGRDRAGTLQTVRALAPDLGFEVIEAGQLSSGGSRISSTVIRGHIEAGRLARARRLLGRRYAVIGEVVHGDARGRTLGYPTANLRFDESVALPPNGVYAVLVTWGGPDPLHPEHRADGVASLGVRPTFGGGERLLEVHLLDFDGDLYGVRLRVEFVRRQRGERKFDSIGALVRQMDADAARSRRILGAGRG